MIRKEQKGGYAPDHLRPSSSPTVWCETAGFGARNRYAPRILVGRKFDLAIERLQELSADSRCQQLRVGALGDRRA